MIILDADGNERDRAWLEANYGPLVIHEPFAPEAWAWRVVKLQENRNGQHFVLVTVLDENGSRVVGKPIPWYFSTAPIRDPNPYGPPDGVPPEMSPDGYIRWVGPGWTNANGQIGLGMSYDGQYQPPAIGPYGAWVGSPTEHSAVVWGLGWLLGSAYWHFDVTFQLAQAEEPPPPPPEEVIALLELARVKIAEADAHVAEAIALLEGV